MKRLDAFGEASELPHLSSFTGRVLDRALDDVLQFVVSEAAAQLNMPIGLVSLITQRSQRLRVHITALERTMVHGAMRYT